jgi:hypothetical protein
MIGSLLVVAHGCMVLLGVGCCYSKAAEKEPEIANQTDNFWDAALKAAKQRVSQEGWPVYREFEVEDLGDDVRLYAPHNPPTIEDDAPGQPKIRSLVWWEDSNLLRAYAPLLDAPDLFLEFASLSRKGGMEREEAVKLMLDWAETYGTLGVGGDGARGESLLRFGREAGEAGRCLELYQAATAKIGRRGDPDVEVLDGYGILGATAMEKREHALEEVTNTVAQRVKNHCYPKLYRRVNLAANRTLRFEEGWGFHSLLGAMYLQMMWLMTRGGDTPRCKMPGCNNFVRLGRYQKEDAALMVAYERRGVGRPPRYKTRRDKEFCSRNCKEKWRYHNVVKPRNRQRAGTP